VINHQFCLKHCSQTNPVVLCLHALRRSKLADGCREWLAENSTATSGRALSVKRCPVPSCGFVEFAQLDLRYWTFCQRLHRPFEDLTHFFSGLVLASMHINTEALLTPLVWWAFRKSLLRFKLFWCVAASVGLHGFKGEHTDSIRMPGPCKN
jgi:hypothetical protein